MGFIYKITNTLNNKIYIGQTIHTIQERWSKHCGDSKRSKTLIGRAICKYGKENFKVEEIEEVPNENLNDREIFWIDHYKSTVEFNNYNLSDGGSDSNTYKYKTDLEMDDIKKKISDKLKGRKEWKFI